METFLPLQIVSLSEYAIYVGACLLNFLAAVWMASAIVHMRETDFWLLRAAITVVGLAYAIVTVSLFTPPQYPPPPSVTDPGFSSLMFKSVFAVHAQPVHIFWIWVTPILGVLALFKYLGVDLVSNGIMRLATYLTALLAIWGVYITFTEQNAFAELATYYGFYAANLGAATWMIGNSLMITGKMLSKRLVYLGVSVIYAFLVVAAVMTMQMILESPY